MAEMKYIEMKYVIMAAIVKIISAAYVIMAAAK